MLIEFFLAKELSLSFLCLQTKLGGLTPSTEFAAECLGWVKVYSASMSVIMGWLQHQQLWQNRPVYNNVKIITLSLCSRWQILSENPFLLVIFQK